MRSNFMHSLAWTAKCNAVHRLRETEGARMGSCPIARACETPLAGRRSHTGASRRLRRRALGLDQVVERTHHPDFPIRGVEGNGWCRRRRSCGDICLDGLGGTVAVAARSRKVGGAEREGARAIAVSFALAINRVVDGTARIGVIVQPSAMAPRRAGCLIGGELRTRRVVADRKEEPVGGSDAHRSIGAWECRFRGVNSANDAGAVAHRPQARRLGQRGCRERRKEGR